MSQFVSAFALNISKNNHGVVGATYNGVSGKVCGYGWGISEANVTCREMGFKGR